MAQDENHTTPNLYQAAAIRTAKEKLLGIEVAYGEKKHFVFARNNNVDRVVHEFLSGTLVQNVQDYIDSWRQLRRLLDAEDMNGYGNGKNHRQ